MGLTKDLAISTGQLLQAYKGIRPYLAGEDDGGDGVQAGPSGGNFRISDNSKEWVQKASNTLLGYVGTYPTLEIPEQLLSILLSVRDSSAPAREVHGQIHTKVRDMISKVTATTAWRVVHSVRAMPWNPTPYNIAGVSVGWMDKDTYLKWGQRFGAQQMAPAADAPLPKRWLEDQGHMLNQCTATVDVMASDDKHALSEGRATIGEVFDLVRYAQLVTHWPNSPVPDFGVTIPGAHTGTEDRMLLMELNPFRISSHGSFGASGTSLEFVRPAPAFSEIETLLQVPRCERSEMQRRVVLALAWVGQAALTSSLSNRLVSLVTALETMLIDGPESRGKRSKIASRVSALSRMTPWLPFSYDEADELYHLRSACLHEGRTLTDELKVERCGIAVAHTLWGLLSTRLNGLNTLNEVLRNFADPPPPDPGAASA